MKLLSQIQDFWKVTGNTIADTLCFVKQRIPVLRLPPAGVLAVQYNLPYVVYGRTGICQVTGVTTMRVDGSSGEKLYYVLRPGGETDGKIFTPVEGGKQVLRGIITREEAERLIDEIPSIETLSIENEKFREDSYKKCIRTCECRDLLRIIKTIYVRKQARLSHGKKTTATDERYLKLAEDHLYSEFSMLLDIPKEHMADYIEQRVHQQEEAEEQVCAV